MRTNRDILAEINRLSALLGSPAPHPTHEVFCVPFLREGPGRTITFQDGPLGPTLEIVEDNCECKQPDKVIIYAHVWRGWLEFMRLIALKLIEVEPRAFKRELDTILMAAHLGGLSIDLPEIDPCKQHLSGAAAAAALGMQRRDHPPRQTANSLQPSPTN